MSLTKTKGTQRAALQRRGVCAELRQASAMHSVASAPGVHPVTSPVETGLFGFSWRNQRSQSITVLHMYLLSQQNPIRTLKRTPNPFRFGG